MSNTPLAGPRNASRREFLRRAAALTGGVGTAGMPLALNLAAMSAAASTPSDYKAIVCLFLYGGNDASNTVLATDPASWSTYQAYRSIGAEPIALLPAGTPPDAAAAAATPAALGGVLPLSPAFGLAPANAGRSFALHPSMGEAAGLFGAGRLSIIANAGTLTEPLTQSEFFNSQKRVPAKLFSHNDQFASWQALSPDARVGWGGRLGDLLASMNGATQFTNISVSGNAVFMAGQSVVQYQVGSNGAVAVAGLGGQIFGSYKAGTKLRSIMTADNQHLFAKEHALVARRSIDAQAMFQTAFDSSSVVAPSTYYNPGTRAASANSLARQLQTVARVIGAAGELGAKRQVFFVSMGGFDTHDNQNRSHGDLLARLSHALGYFDGALGSMGLRDKVTLFTASDFGRAFASNGDGTDHGWGGHHFVMGGAQLRGREIVGRFPALGPAEADAVSNGALLPSIAVDQIGATLGRWFGASETDLDQVFPNLGNFSSRDLGFLI
jgi:uncharacterized protein (DUF1501 family)